jgi:two-component system, sensor histidine kinase and response regulator
MDPYPTAGAGFPATDPTALDRLRRFGGQKLLREMITLFLAAVPERIAAAREAIGSADAAGAERAFHALKSSAAQLGAMQLQRLCEEGELKARAGSLDAAAALLPALESERDLVHAWLSAARDEEAP